MKLAFLCHPTKDMNQSLSYYKEVLGLEEAWREGDHTVALRFTENEEVQLMVEDDEGLVPSGGVFVIEDVNQFYEENQHKLSFIKEPCDIPPGRYAIFQDPDGNPFRIIDMTKNKNISGNLV
ncbi:MULTISPECIES: VOC family protein [Pontibacillus]|uniref:VOC family protein n=1 Tax=Pontibacillus chungwhensis TaxID=265426 RepID=A0ABY8UVP9_9BACI|nr:MULTISPECIES: VOC family protein [Pontibacillus]MCD5323197.1 VOC family protein [Pontibacillus sp. HN14]WIF96584.1 VOC family protein [Pontibacillus chungwhensis]